MKCKLLFCYVSVGILLSACGSQENFSLRSHQGFSKSSIDDLVGVYAEKVQITTIDKVPSQGEMENVGNYYNINTFSIDQGKLISSSHACRSLMKSNSQAKLTISDKVTQVIPAMTGEVQVSEKDGKTFLQRAMSIAIVSVKLDDPWNDALPTDKNDKRIFDLDGDGNPGISIDIKASIISGKIYAIRRERNHWDATQDSDGHIRGLIYDSSEQRVVGASNSMFNVNPESKQHPDANRSTVELVRLAGDINCADLIKKIPTLFPAS